MVKKIGAALIISGFLIPLILLLFFGDNWVPTNQLGIIFSIMNTDLKFYESEYLNQINKNKKYDTDIFDLPLYSKEDKEKDKEERFTIPFRYAVGGGLISIVLGSFIFIKEMN